MGKAKKFGIGVGIVFLILIALGALANLGANEKQKELQTPALTPAEIKAKALTTVTYDDLLRNNENYVGKIVYYRGHVIQAQNIYGDTYILRVEVKQNDDILWSDPVWVNYAGSRILEGDIIDVWGQVKGIKQYQAVLGNQVEIPEIDSMIVQLVQKQG